MTSRLPAVTPRQAIRVLERCGWTLDRVKGSHQVFRHPEHRNRIVVPMHAVNASIYDAAIASIAQDATWDFFCECGDPACDERTPLTLNRYEQLRDAGQAILAPGHHVDEKARARALRADAQALRAPAQHQVRRARKNIDESGLRS